MAFYFRSFKIKSLKLFLVIHVVLLYCMIFVYVYQPKPDADDKWDRTKLDLGPASSQIPLGPAPKDLNKLLIGSNGARLMNAIVTSYRRDIELKIMDLISRNADPRDPELLLIVRQLMDPPSGHIVKRVRNIVETPQSVEIWKYLKKQKGGFFVEAGGLDGEQTSNTLYLEQRQGWTGLLIEADPYYYTQLMGKSRRSWSINACISPYQYTTMMEFKEASGAIGQLIFKEQDNRTLKRKGLIEVPCFPLETMLLAINRTHVDYFSLDVEGFELDVLKTIPFDRIDISTLSVEYVHGRNGKKAYEAYMLGKGYRVHKDIHVNKPEIALYVDDFIFVKN